MKTEHREPKILKELDSRDWLYWGQWVEPPLSTDFWLHWSENKVASDVFKNRFTSNTIKINGHFYIWRKDYNYILEKGYLSARAEDYKFFEDFFEKTSDVVKDFLLLEKEFKNKSFSDSENFEQFVLRFKILFTPWFIIFPLSAGVEKSLIEQTKNSGIELPQLTHLFVSKEQPWTNIHYKKILELVQTFKEKDLEYILVQNDSQVVDELKREDAQLLNLLEKHVKKYEWIGIHNFWGTPYSLKELVGDMQNVLNQELVDQEKYGKNEKPDISISHNLKKHIDLVNSLSYWRFHCAEVSDYIEYKFRPHLTNLAKNFDINYEDLIWFNTHEILEFLKGRRKPKIDIVAKRKRGYGAIYYSKQEKVITDSGLVELRNIFKEEKITKNKILEGIMASKGYAKGEVKLVLDPDDVQKFKKDQILISPETTPDFVSAMKKAAAIVTDIGGLTSHAAIVARELKKPCIIGTKIATKTFKNGDVVEVDANEGVVKILKRVGE